MKASELIKELQKIVQQGKDPVIITGDYERMAKYGASSEDYYEAEIEAFRDEESKEDLLFIGECCF